MKSIVKTLTCLSLLALMASTVPAQNDPFGAMDTVWADVARIDDVTMTVTISFFNDEPVVGLAIPLHLDAGANKIVADSAVYTGGRIAEAEWTYPGFRPDTAIQCVTLGMIANIGPSDHKLLPGKGRVATIFVSSLEDKKIESLKVDTTTTHPGNRLMAVAYALQGEAPDTVRVHLTDRQIHPVWVVRYDE
ncbi:MAG: hypothetical protein ACYTA5_26530 [Planctomycetota bacterium]|jgi:hypothetical protein